MSSSAAPPRELAWIDDGTPLPYVATLPVLGVATRFATNERAALALVDDAFGCWGALGAHDATCSDDPVEVRIVVAEQGRSAPSPAPIRHAMDDDLRFVAWSPDGVAATDPARRAASLRVGPALVADGDRFRSEMLESAVLALLSCFDRHPVHAAAVAREGRAVLLAAPSGTGKSTLAYACHVAGLDLLGDDHVRVQLEPALRIWGWPSRVRLAPEIAERTGAAPAPASSSDGKGKCVVDARERMSAARLVARDATVCLLSRDGGPLALQPLEAAPLADALDAQLAPGFDRFPARWPAVRRALSARGGWRLNLSGDAREGVRAVRRLLEVGES